MYSVAESLRQVLLLVTTRGLYLRYSATLLLRLLIL